MFDLLVHNARILTLEERQTIDEGYLLIGKGRIVKVGTGKPPKCAVSCTVDAEKMIVMPGLVDCHTHLLEYGAAEIHKAQGSAQMLAGQTNLLTALKCGIVALGEHHLGHPVLNQTFATYNKICSDVPLDVKLASGCCFIGTDPLVLVSSTSPGTLLAKEDLTADTFAQMADESNFPGENLFLNATVANLPFDAAPRAGELTFTPEEVKKIVGIFHARNKRVGAHIEGDRAAKIFIDAGGDVISHGHAVSESVGHLMAQRGIPLIITPHGGTRSIPTSPEEAFRFYKQGVQLAIASDSYLPVHPEAPWINLPPGSLVGPEEFLTISKPVLDFFVEKGVDISDTLKLITLNGRRILEPGEAAGSISVGSKADIIITEGIPAIETVCPQDIKYVIKDGSILVAR